jgi:hypothetical protein
MLNLTTSLINGLSLFCFLFFFNTNVFAQAFPPAPGYAVMLKGDTLKGDIKYKKKDSYMPNMQVKLADGTSKALSPKMTALVKAGEDIFESFLVPGTEDRAFFHRLIAGKLNFYEYKYDFYQFNNTVTKTEYYVRKQGGDELIKINQANCKKKMTELFNNDAKLSARLEAKDFKFEDLGELIEEFNQKP